MITTTREIPREEWVSFFNNFSRSHEAWPVRIEVFGVELGAQLESSSLRFTGINADLKDGQNRITIDLGITPHRSMSHAIAHPTHVWLGRRDGERGAFETLDIQSENGVTTLIKFDAATSDD